MAVYQYNAIDLDESAVDGTIIADTARAARDMLRDRGLMVTHIAASREAGKLRLAGGPSRKDRYEVVSFIRELATLLKAGISLLTALNTLASQHSRRFRPIIQHLSDQVASGVGLAEAMGQQSAYFDSMCVSITAVGENTGSLEIALKRLADFKDRANRLTSKVTTALIYPAFVCAFGLIISLFLMSYVVPNLLSSLTAAGKELPAITKIVKGLSDFLLNWWWALLAGLAGLVVLFKMILASQSGRKIFDRLLLNMPMIGQLLRKENTSRIAIILAALLRSGLQFVQAVQITRSTVKNRLFAKALEDYELAVASGKDVAGPLAASGVFSPMVIQMLAVGQHAGNLEEMLEQLAETYDQEIAVATARLTAMLEPILIVVLAILVAFIAFATILPIMEMSNVIQ
jgi:type II secretory pathway component PulF